MNNLRSREDGFYNRNYFEVINENLDGAIKKFLVKDIRDNETYLYKFSKINSFGERTYEHYSEYISKNIGDMIHVPVVDIILDHKAILSRYMWGSTDLHNFVEYSEELYNSFHLSNLTTFNIKSLLDVQKNKYVSKIVQMLLFDILIGNSDRHPGNFLYNEEKGFYPLFDNGSSLCCYVRDCDIKNILNDKMRFNALLVTKSKPVLRDDQKITHKELLGILKGAYRRDFDEFVTNLHELDIAKLLECVSDLSQERLDLLDKYITERLRWYYE